MIIHDDIQVTKDNKFNYGTIAKRLQPKLYSFDLKELLQAKREHYSIIEYPLITLFYFNRRYFSFI